MISYKRRTLKNGLTVVVNRDRSSKLSAVNLLYKVGARNESPERTGFAHLFEHLMFRGTTNVPTYDLPVQMASGEDNAFTNNDYTNFYLTLPVGNIETGLWLESDRMQHLDITSAKLETEKRVVIEEFRQRYLNQPYGDQTMLLRQLAYTTHPYRWCTIGLTPDHIAAATLEEVETFYRTHYRPSNAIVGISADLDEEQMLDMVEEWFGQIVYTPTASAPYPMEPEQTVPRRLVVERDVPATTVSLAFPMGDRRSADFYTGDLVSDLLSSGDSSRLYQHLVKERRLFASVNAYISGDVDPGLFILTGQLLPETEEEQAIEALREEVTRLGEEGPTPYELEKVKNKFEANTLFGELNVMNKAMNLCYYDFLGDLSLINGEVALYRAIDRERIDDFIRRTFTDEHCSTLIYRAK